LLGVLLGGIGVLISYWIFGHCILRKTKQTFTYQTLLVGIIFLATLILAIYGLLLALGPTN